MKTLILFTIGIYLIASGLFGFFLHPIRVSEGIDHDVFAIQSRFDEIPAATSSIEWKDEIQSESLSYRMVNVINLKQTAVRGWDNYKRISLINAFVGFLIFITLAIGNRKTLICK